MINSKVPSLGDSCHLLPSSAIGIDRPWHIFLITLNTLSMTRLVFCPLPSVKFHSTRSTIAKNCTSAIAVSPDAQYHTQKMLDKNGIVLRCMGVRRRGENRVCTGNIRGPGMRLPGLSDPRDSRRAFLLSVVMPNTVLRASRNGGRRVTSREGYST